MGLLQVLGEYSPEYRVSEIFTVGDSPNDESLFEQRYFPISVGVANVSKYSSQVAASTSIHNDCGLRRRIF